MKGSLEPRLLLALIMTEICSLSLSRQVSRMLQTQISSVKLFRPARYTDLEIILGGASSNQPPAIQLGPETNSARSQLLSRASLRRVSLFLPNLERTPRDFASCT